MKSPIVRLFAVLFFCCVSSLRCDFDPIEISELLEQFKAGNICYVDFLFTDILGELRSVTVPLCQVYSALHHGIKFDGSSIAGYSTIYQSDMHLKPDIATCKIISSKLSQPAHARIICDVYKTETEPYEADPRWILKQHMEYTRQQLGYTFNVGPELEFFMVTISDDSTLAPCDTQRYFDCECSTSAKQQQVDLINALLENNIAVEKLHHEVAPGQFEISISYADALSMADQIVLAKHVIKQYATSIGMKATFMPKPIHGINGSGMHVHFSLFDEINAKNAFYQAGADAHLSPIAQQFIAGVLKSIPHASAFCNPTVNSYKRLVAGYEAPVYVCWAKKNRSALIRIPQINECQPSAARAELRSPDGMSNPYVLFSLLLRAGIEGIENQENLQPPLDENTYKLLPEELLKNGVTTLPSSLQNSLQLLHDNAFVVRALGARFVHEFLHLKRKEVEAFNRYVTNWEVDRYL